ncbi:MAG: right-handed parallel beta-helix repeat-containing protein [Bacteroidetes bacterium]|nr:MAG: right-handed parallel beta-helix repeat-containing protein [Bacteroidota bacterium]
MRKLNLNLTLFMIGAAALLFTACKGEGPIIPDTTTVITCDGTLPLVWKNNPDLAVDYLVTCMVELGAGQNLVIEPGVTVQFEDAESGILVSEGSLKMLGNASAPITLEGKTAIKGSWKGIFYSSNSVNNRMEYVTVSHAGSEEQFLFNNRCGVGLYSGFNATRLSIKNCTLSDNDGFGFLAQGVDANLADFEANTFTRNSEAPVFIGINLLNKIDASSVYTVAGKENGKSYIAIDASWPDMPDVTLAKLTVPYRFLSGEPVDVKKMTLSPGVILEFEQGSYLNIDDDGDALIAVGTQAEPIIFRGSTGVAGSWGGIYIGNSNILNRLEYCTVEHGGEFTLFSAKANIELGGATFDPACVVKNCLIRNSLGYGIAYRDGAAAVVLENNTFSGNALGDLQPY